MYPTYLWLLVLGDRASNDFRNFRFTYGNRQLGTVRVMFRTILISMFLTSTACKKLNIVNIFVLCSLVLCNCASKKMLDSYCGKYYSQVDKAYIVDSKPKRSETIGNSSFSDTDHMFSFFPTHEDAISVAKKIGATHVRFELKSRWNKVNKSISRYRPAGSEYYDELPTQKHTGFTAYARNQNVYHPSLDGPAIEYGHSRYRVFWFQTEFYRLSSLLIGPNGEQSGPIKTKPCKQKPRFNNFKFWAKGQNR